MEKKILSMRSCFTWPRKWPQDRLKPVLAAVCSRSGCRDKAGERAAATNNFRSFWRQAQEGRCSIMSEILDIAHEMAQDLFKAGAMDEITMREIDALCLLAKRPIRSEASGASGRPTMSAKPSSPRCSAPARRRCSSGKGGARNRAVPPSGSSTLSTARDWPLLAE